MMMHAQTHERSSLPMSTHAHDCSMKSSTARIPHRLSSRVGPLRKIFFVRIKRVVFSRAVLRLYYLI